MDGLCKCKTKLGSLTARVHVLSLGKPGSWYATFRGCSGKKLLPWGVRVVSLPSSPLQSKAAVYLQGEKKKTPTFSQLGPGGDRDNHGHSKDATELTVEFRKRQNSPYHVTTGTDWKWG